MKKITQSLSIYRLLILSWALCTFTKPIQCAGGRLSSIIKSVSNLKNKYMKNPKKQLEDVEGDVVTEDQSSLENQVNEIKNSTPKVVESSKVKPKNSLKKRLEEGIKNTKQEFMNKKQKLINTKEVFKKRLKTKLTTDSSKSSLFTVNHKVDESLNPILDHVKKTATTLQSIKKDVKATLKESKETLEQIKTTYKKAGDNTLGKVQTAATAVTILCGVLIVYLSIQTLRTLKPQKNIEEGQV